eukprot:6768474-Lingulodinium_polyedra.AAC.1
MGLGRRCFQPGGFQQRAVPQLYIPRRERQLPCQRCQVSKLLCCARGYRECDNACRRQSNRW